MEPGSGLRRSPWPAVGLVSAIAVTLALLVAVLGGLDGFTPHFGTAPSNLRSLDRSAALGELTAGTVRLDYGAARLTIRAEDLGADLYRAHFEVSQDVNATADVDRASGTVAVKLNTLNRPCVFGCRRTARLDLALNDRLPWRLDFSGGACDGTLDLASLKLSGLDLSAGATNLSISLPSPGGTVPLRFDGGASSLHLQAPAATQVRIEIDAGSSSLRVNGSRSSAFGSGLSYESDGYSGGADRYQLSASGGAADLSWSS